MVQDSVLPLQPQKNLLKHFRCRLNPGTANLYSVKPVAKFMNKEEFINSNVKHNVKYAYNTPYKMRLLKC